jgi:hypothetical protein
MPWVRRKNKIYKKLSSGKLEIKQTCRSAENAKKAIKLLRGLEHGTIKKRS